MANLKDIRRRIKSVKNMQQITKAMKMVSAARLRRAQERVVSSRPYAQTMSHVLENLAIRAGEYHHPLLEERGDESYLVVLITSDRGLCGAFNTNLIKATASFIRENAGKKLRLVTIGRRGRDYFRRRSTELIGEHINVVGKAVPYDVAARIAQEIMEFYLNEDLGIDRVFIIYNEFKSVISQKLVLEQLLPIGGFGARDEAERAEPAIDFIYEQPAQQIFGRLLPMSVETRVYQAMVESLASEHGARMTAMDSASKNASQMIDRLTLHANRVRQASITNEILEVVGGAEALEG
jgi:F-type H+-transporting ATPase subunit gamma